MHRRGPRRGRARLDAAPAGDARADRGRGRARGRLDLRGRRVRAGRGDARAAVERYDIRRRRWSRVPRHAGRGEPRRGGRAPRPAVRAAAATGGERPRRARPPRCCATTRAPAAGGRLPSAPSPRAAHAAAVVGGRLYVAGGANDTGSLDSLEVYDFARRRWRRGPSFPGPARNHTTGVASGGHFYVLAGRDAGNLAAAERYDPRRRRWQRAARRCARRAAGSPPRACATGASWSSAARTSARAPRRSAEVELFDPRTRRWRSLPDMRTPRHGLGGVALGNRVFAVEGGPAPGLALLGRDRVPRRTLSRAVIPLKDDIPTRRFAVVTVVFIAINVAVYFLFEQGLWSLGQTGSERVLEYGAIRCEITEPGSEVGARPTRRPSGSRSSPRCSCTAACSTSAATCCSCGSSATTSRTRWDG